MRSDGRMQTQSWGRGVQVRLGVEWSSSRGLWALHRGQHEVRHEANCGLPQKECLVARCLCGVTWHIQMV